jgi:DNA invertase Pin-like site-specific DNA recombinase
MKRAALYMRVSTVDQHPENQLNELRQFASQRGFQIIEEYTDHRVSGTKARRPSLDRMLKDAHQKRFDVVVVWACDRLARSTKHFLQVLDELNELGVQFLSQREAIDPDGPLGRAIVVIVSAVAELERSLIVERVKAGMRRAKLDGRRIGGVAAYTIGPLIHGGRCVRPNGYEVPVPRSSPRPSVDAQPDPSVGDHRWHRRIQPVRIEAVSR